MKRFALFCLALVALPLCAYNPPIGIPNPANYFEGLDPIDAPKPDPATYAPGWFASPVRAYSAAAGDAHPYYYVDLTTGNDSTSGTYGSPTKPRKTMPASSPSAPLAPGSYIEVHGGTLATTYRPYAVASAAAPVWIVGVGGPTFLGGIEFGAANTPRISYIIFDGINVHAGTALNIHPGANMSVDHIVFRNCRFNGSNAVNDSTGIAVGAYDPSVPPTAVTQNIVFYKCESGNFGDWMNPGEECGFYIRAYVTNAWFLDGYVHDNAEDGFGGGHGQKCTSTGYFIGRNRIEHNQTDIADIKAVYNVIMSQNRARDHMDLWEDWDTVNMVPLGTVNTEQRLGVRIQLHADGTYHLGNTSDGKNAYEAISPRTGQDINHKSSGGGAGATYHYGASSSGPDYWHNFPQDSAVLFNDFLGSRAQFGISSCGTVRVVGNLFRSSRSLPTSYGDAPYAVDLRGIAGDTWIVNNTFYDCEGGLHLADSVDPYAPGTTYHRVSKVLYNGVIYWCINDNNYAGIVGITPTDTTYWRPYRVRIFGNVFANRYNPSVTADVKLDSASFLPCVDMDYNLAWHPSAGGAYSIGAASQRDLTWIKGAYPQFQAHGKSTDPKLVAPNDPTLPDLSVAVDSPARAAIDPTAFPQILQVYDNYFGIYGENIRREYNGNARPTGSAWDLGAYQYGSTPPGNPPTAPTGLTADPLDVDRIELFWTDTSSDATAFRVEATQTAGTGWTQIAAPSTPHHIATTLVPGTTYYFRVRALNLYGASAYSNTVQATTNALPSSVVRGRFRRAASFTQ